MLQWPLRGIALFTTRHVVLISSREKSRKTVLALLRHSLAVAFLACYCRSW